MKAAPGRIGALVTVALLAAAARGGAHEIGTMRVSALLVDGRYDIAIVTDAVSLLEKLDAAAGAPGPAAPATGVNPAALGTRLVALDEVFRRRVEVAFDGSPVRPAITYSVSPAVDATSAPLAAIHLSGAMPRGARHFTWLYSWSFASYALSMKSREAGDPVTEWLEGAERSTPLAVAGSPRPGRLATAWQYLVLGFTHIVPHGLDHVLFVIGLFLLGGCLRTVLWQVSAFTVAHSVTLALSMYGVLGAPPALVEPLIALSIAYVAIENVFLTELRRWRVVLVFVFGLLHGMGFAGALREAGLPRSEFLAALLTFNVGVEAGQLAVIAAAFALVGWQWSNRAVYRRRVVVPASLVIACTAVYWTVERVAF